MSTSNKKVINGWAMYDWANSVYNLVITTTFFPAYFVGITKNPATNDYVNFFGFNVLNSALYTYALSFANLLIVFCLPILSSIADTRGNKKGFLRFFCTLGAIGCSAMFFFSKDTIGPWYLEYGVICFILATLGYSGGLVFYNSYLPEIAPVKDRDRVSARGYAFGYVGSVILQLVGFALVALQPFGISTGMAITITFLLVGIWWFSFAQVTFRVLPSHVAKDKAKGNIFRDGFTELKKVYRQVGTMPVLKTYLRAFFFYSMGVQTVMLAATIFGKKELQMEDKMLIFTVVVIQIVAILGAWAMARASEKYGNFKVLIFTVALWVCVCTGAYFTHTQTQFFILAGLVGLVMGGIQSLSRSTYAKLIPETKDTASFFSYYDVTEKLAIVIGTFSFGFIEQMTSSMRNSVLVLIVFFSIGLLWLFSALHKQRKLAAASQTTVGA
ncbi:MFS transporter [Chitinophaga horti]|uniref:MFS transporter n=1 Tax=Chitinophaga horti TaxID=2920382 RepID=A0ABY6J0Z0_9BACT|nr:MFS transporter [Chitinophaga horti]UYQ93300.1 MFS transporter [Chitinophaga horti]